MVVRLRPNPHNMGLPTLKTQFIKKKTTFINLVKNVKIVFFQSTNTANYRHRGKMYALLLYFNNRSSMSQVV